MGHFPRPAAARSTPMDRERPPRQAERLRRNRTNGALLQDGAQEQIWNMTLSLSREMFVELGRGRPFPLKSQLHSWASRPSRRADGLGLRGRAPTWQSHAGPSSSRRHSPSKDGRLSTPYARLLRFAPALRVTTPSRRGILSPWTSTQDPAACAGLAASKSMPEPRGGSTLTEGDPARP